MNCKYCPYSHYLGPGISGGYKCTHPDIEISAKIYEKTHKRINKSVDHIGYNMIKTSMRWCPLKMEEQK